MLRVTEEILLLTLDAASGAIQYSLPQRERDLLFACAVLMDLSLEGRIDTDPERLYVVDPAPLDDDLLDPTLLEIAGQTETHDAAFWIERTAARSGDVRETALDRLTAHGILERDTNGLVFSSRSVALSRRYPEADGTGGEDVRSRVMATLFSADIPDPRDAMIIGLGAACGVFESILSKEELAGVEERIDAVSRLDLLGRTIREAVPTISPPPPPVTRVRPYEEIPEVPGLPLAGNAFQMAGDVREFLAGNYREFGPIFRIRAFGFRFIALVGPEANVYLGRISGTHLRSHEPYREFGVAAGAHRVMLSMDGAEHLRMRKLQTKGYSPKTIESNLDIVHDVTQRAIDHWPIGAAFGVQHAMQRIVTEQIGQCLTGRSPAEYVDDLIFFLETILSIHVTHRMPKLMERLPRFRRAKRRLQGFVEAILEAHLPERRAGQAPDFVDDLLEMNQADPQFLPETDLFTNVLAPFLVGIDTSASVCAFMLYSLVKQPDILERMRQEVDAMYEHGTPTPEGLRELDVTHRVALETLRMYPVIPAITRTVSNSFEFGGYRVPAGKELMLGTTVGHHLPECFPEPERFDIERHSPDARRQRRPGAFAPFGVGRHRCIGSGFSEVQIALTLATIVRETELELERPERPLKINVSPAPHPDDSLRVRLVRRRQG